MAEAELSINYFSNRVLPVFITFRKSSLIHTTDPNQFFHWMLSRLCIEILRAIKRVGGISFIPDTTLLSSIGPKTNIEHISEMYENSWKTPNMEIDTSVLPTIEQFIYSIDEICNKCDIKYINLLIDEAAHVFIPEQQRQFFTLFRDIRSPFISCNAAVYPGVTSYGETFQPNHDATLIMLNRSVQHDNYVKNMKELVVKQIGDTAFRKRIEQRGENFAVLAYAANGNPRNLLKTLQMCQIFDSNNVNAVIREFYRDNIWSEHSNLVNKYPGYKKLIDWGRMFIEETVLPETQSKNIQYRDVDKSSTSYFWVHRDAPQSVKEALRLLQYTGIVIEQGNGLKATRSEIGTRYMVNLGCLLALENTPTASALNIAKHLSIKRMSEYGMNHPAYLPLTNEYQEFIEPDYLELLDDKLQKNIDVLDLTQYQIEKLYEIGINTIGSLLNSSEEQLMKIDYIGEKRARRIRNTATAAVYEYLIG